MKISNFFAIIIILIKNVHSMINASLYMRNLKTVSLDLQCIILQGQGVGPGSAIERWPYRKIARKSAFFVKK